MSNKKRALTLALLIVFVLTTALTGCGQIAGETPSPVASASSEATATAEVSATTEPSASEEPVKLEMVKLKYFAPSGPQKADAQAAVQAEVNKLLTEKINAEMELNLIDWGVWFDKFPVILASGEQADLMFSASWSSYTTEAAKNSFLDVTDLLKQYGQGITGSIQDGFIKAATIKGKLFAVPENKDAAQGYALFLQKDILDKAGVKPESIKSLDDLTPVLEYVSKNEKGLIPMPTILDAGGLYICTADGFAEGVADYSRYEIGYDSWRGIVVYDSKEDKFKSLDPSVSKTWMSYAKLMSSWSKSGYFMKDILTNKSVDAGLMWKEGKTWMTTSSDVPGQLETITASVGKEVVQIPMLPGICNTDSMTGSLTTIPRASIDPARAMMTINLMHTDKDLVNLMVSGVEGKNYVKTGDNSIKLPDGIKLKSDTGWDPGNWWMVGNAFLNYIWDTDLQNRWEAVKTYNDKAPRSSILGFSFDSTNVKAEVATVNTVFEQYKRLIQTGSGDTEKYVTEMFDKMNAGGLDKIIAEYNVQLVEWKAAQ